MKEAFEAFGLSEGGQEDGPDKDVARQAFMAGVEWGQNNVPQQLPCPYCHGSGRWETECCSGARGCSCRGMPVDMGACNVCQGRGYVVEGCYDINANLNTIRGLCYIGSGPR